MDRFTTRFFPENRFGGFTDVDGSLAFYGRIRALVNADSVVVDYGCGRGALADDPSPYRRKMRILKGHVRRVIGMDVDPAAADNPYIDEYRPISPAGSGWPIESATADAIVSDCVLEHLADPSAFFRETARVLRSGGYLCIRTTNAWGYVAIAARLLPSRSHISVLRAVQDERQDQDVFPAYYRCNTRAQISREFRASGLDGVVVGFEPEPRYLEFSALAYRLGLLYARLAPSGFRNCLLAWARKP